MGDVNPDLPVVVLADTEAWEAFTWLGAALRHRGFQAVRLTAPPGTRLQRVSSAVYRIAYNRTEVSLRWPGGTEPVDVAGVDCVWQPNVVDVQAADRVGAALLADPRWREHPRLHRVPDPDREMRLFNKLSQTQDALAAGCPVPRTWSDPAEVDTERVVIKQRLGSGGDAVVIVPTAEIPVWVRRWTGQGGGLVFQEPVAGEVLNVGGFARDGELVVAAAYATEHAADDPEGPSVRIRTVQRPDLLESVEAYVAQTKYTGAICVDFISADEGYLIDVNPRFFGSWAAIQAAGLPLLEAYTEHLRQQPIGVTNPDLGAVEHWTEPARDGTRLHTARTGIRVLREFAEFTGPRGYVAGLPSLGRAIRSAG